MYLSTFEREGIKNEERLVQACIFRLLFISPNETTNINIERSPNKGFLQSIRYNENVSKYVFVPSYHRIGYTLVTKQLLLPQFRQGEDIDFLYVESEIFVEYLKLTDTFTSLFTLN